jgi:hypothetical protein
VPSALRTLLTAALPVVLLVGSLLISHYGQDRALNDAEDAKTPDIETMYAVSPEDEDRMQRVALKEETALDMLDGRLTVEEAATQFLEVASSDPASLENMRLSPGDTDEEKALSQLVSYARVQAGRQPQRYRAAFARVEQVAKSLERPKLVH